MYLDYFSLKKFPFRITPDPSLFFPGGADGRGVVLDALIYAITSGEGILKVVGEVGSGKTMLCRMLGGRLSDSVEIVYLANPNLSARDIIFAIAFELELDVDSSTERLLAMHKLQDYLLKKHSEGGTVVVFIEEAQSMPLEALEEIRLLSNLETHQHKLMQIVLFGQPELDRKLQKKSIRQLRERITHSFNLEPLSVDATRDYLRFRLQAAGCPWPQLFHLAAEKKLAKAATGLTRRINILADKAMMAAYADSSTRQEPRNSSGEIQSMVLPRHVKAAIKDSGYNNNITSLIRYAGLGLGSIVVVGLLVSFINQFNFSSTVSTELPVVTQVLSPIVEAPTQIAQNQEAQTLPEETEVVALQAEAPIEPEVVTVALTEVPESLIVPVEEEFIAIAEPEHELIPAPTPVVEDVIDEILPETLPETLVEATVETIDQILVEVVEDTTIEPLVEAETNINPVSEIRLENPNDTNVSISTGVGLVALRSQSTQAWLGNLPEGADYTLQLISVPTSSRVSLEEFLQFLSVAGMLDKTHVCTISATTTSPAQWLVLHEEFSGITTARNYIDELPTHLRRYTPFIRNTDDVACIFDND